MNREFVIKQERPNPPAVLWLTRVSPPLWGERENAIKFPSKAEAQQIAASIEAYEGAWSVERA